jgi:hypothetical protein
MIQLSGERPLFDIPATYQIRVQGIVAASWSDRLEGMAISVRESADVPPVTTLLGEVPDQAALTGVLNTLYNMHLPVLSVERLADAPH